ncbi:MAG: type II toxin-antitoxin system RelE/ParE family toxin, partial [bacterium]
MYRYEFSRESLKVLERLDSKIQELLKKKIKNIENWLENKDFLYADIRRLKGEWEGFYRLRIGRIRVIFTVNAKDELIKIHA